MYSIPVNSIHFHQCCVEIVPYLYFAKLSCLTDTSQLAEQFIPFTLIILQLNIGNICAL